MTVAIFSETFTHGKDRGYVEKAGTHAEYVKDLKGKKGPIVFTGKEGKLLPDCFLYELQQLYDKYGLQRITGGELGYISYRGAQGFGFKKGHIYLQEEE